LTRWVNNFPQKCQFKSFNQWKLTLIFSPYKPELSMIRNFPNRLEFKKRVLFHCKPVNQQKTSIFALILWEEQRLNRFWSEKRCRNSTFTFVFVYTYSFNVCICQMLSDRNAFSKNRLFYFLFIFTTALSWEWMVCFSNVQVVLNLRT
jgi:hypothetical protein